MKEHPLFSYGREVKGWSDFYLLFVFQNPVGCEVHIRGMVSSVLILLAFCIRHEVVVFSLALSILTLRNDFDLICGNSICFGHYRSALLWIHFACALEQEVDCWHCEQTEYQDYYDCGEAARAQIRLILRV